LIQELFIDPPEKTVRLRAHAAAEGDRVWDTVPSQGVRLHAIVSRLCPMTGRMFHSSMIRSQKRLPTRAD
jgi:hypothetical protein